MRGPALPRNSVSPSAFPAGPAGPTEKDAETRGLTLDQIPTVTWETEGRRPTS
jgi:hypothetical protein